ncbi:alpha/beta fold hydrolase [Isosphaeraceae bacterium EP7]
MPTIRGAFLALSMLTAFACEVSRGDDVPKSKLAGTWEGKLTIGPASLRLVVNVTQGKDGALSSTLDSPDQGAKGIPVASTTLEGKTFKLDVAVIKGEFSGTLDDAGTKAEGTWTQGPNKLPLTLAKVEKPTEIKRPQTPKAPFPYKAIEVSYPGGEKVTIAGTLTVPEGKGPFPAVLMITGSGAQDRDETIFGHKPFWVLADDLSRAGVAVLRVDDRGVGGSTGDPKAATTKDYIDDVAAGVAFLKGRPEIDAAHIGLIGHSEGGIIAPAVAARTEDVDFIVLLAGTGMTGREILIRQGKLIGEAGGRSAEEIARNTTVQEAMFQILAKQSEDEQIRMSLADLLTKEHGKLSEAERKAVGEVDAFIKAQSDAVLSPWMRYFIAYDPLPTLSKVTCPVLAISGEKDLQVPPENLEAIATALKAGGNMQVTTRLFPGLNHLFQPAETGSPSEYGSIEQTISPAVLETIRNWVKRQAGR